MSRTSAQLRLVVENEVRIARRDAKALLIGALLPLLMFSFIGLIFALNAGDSARDRSTVVYVAVGDRDTGFAAALRAAGGDAVHVETSPDPERAVSLRKVDAAVIVGGEATGQPRDGPPLAARCQSQQAAGQGATKQLQDGAPLAVCIISDGARGKSTVAVPLLEAVLQRAAVQQHVPAPTVPLVDIVRTDATRAPTAGRSLIVRLFPSLVILLCASIADRARSRLVASRSDGTLEALWVLPLRREALLGGVALAVALVGLAVQFVLLVPATLVAGIIAAAGDGSVAVGAGAAMSILVAAIATAFLMACAGSALGAYGQANARAGGVGPLLTALLFFVMMFVPLAQGLENLSGLLPVPILGSVVLIRRGISGKLGPFDPFVVLGVSGVLGLLLLRNAARSISQGGSRNRAR